MRVRRRTYSLSFSRIERSYSNTEASSRKRYAALSNNRATPRNNDVPLRKKQCAFLNVLCAFLKYQRAFLYGLYAFQNVLHTAFVEAAAGKRPFVAFIASLGRSFMEAAPTKPIIAPTKLMTAPERPMADASNGSLPPLSLPTSRGVSFLFEKTLGGVGF